MYSRVIGNWLPAELLREIKAGRTPPAKGDLAFEGAGGACGEFDGVFGAGFFGVLFEG